jgi:YHS domain-containing protein/thiol-disulfide isomerase/thioredoxin
MIPRRTRPRAVASARSVAVVISFASIVLGPARATEPVPIAWRDDYAGALEEARATNRLVWIQFTGPWCPNCLRMERDSFPDADVIDHAQRSFVPLKLRSDVHEGLAVGFNLSGLPATVLVSPSREIIAVRQGYLGPDELDQLLSQGLVSWRGRGAANPPDRPKSVTRLGEEPGPALGGYCPISLVADRKLVAGRAEHSIVHEGRTYRFATAAGLERFRKEPDRYVPANRGDCPVAQLDRGAARPGDPRWGVLYQGRLYLCASADDRRRFLGEPDRYALVDVAEQGFCAHCLGETGLLVRGDPRCAITRDGRRYWFPDPAHRDAFLAANRSASTADHPTATTARR